VTQKLQRRALSLFFAMALVLLLAGCASAPAVDNFDATWPEELPREQATNGAIYQAGYDVPLFENAIAHRVGDTVTVNLIENTNAQKSSSTSTSKDTNIDFAAPTFGNSVIPEVSANVENSRKFEGAGDSKLSNRLQGNVTVTVAKRLANGNLVVRGQKWIEINQGREFVRIQGVIRPIDIQPDNTIPSYKVADAYIAYGQKGVLNAANRPGLLARFFNSVWNPL
jgi:flagellar L-ring protein precursor FlgH